MAQVIHCNYTGFAAISQCPISLGSFPSGSAPTGHPSTPIFISSGHSENASDFHYRWLGVWNGASWTYPVAINVINGVLIEDADVSVTNSDTANWEVSLNGEPYDDSGPGPTLITPAATLQILFRNKISQCVYTADLITGFCVPAFPSIDQTVDDTSELTAGTTTTPFHLASWLDGSIQYKRLYVWNGTAWILTCEVYALETIDIEPANLTVNIYLTGWEVNFGEGWVTGGQNSGTVGGAGSQISFRKISSQCVYLSSAFIDT